MVKTKGREGVVAIDNGGGTITVVVAVERYHIERVCVCVCNSFTRIRMAMLGRRQGLHSHKAYKA